VSAGRARLLVSHGPRLQTSAVGNPPAVDPELLHQQAQAAVLAELRRGDDVRTLVAAVDAYEIPGVFSPDVAILHLAVDALDLACGPGADLLEYEGLRERYLPEIEFRGRVQHRNSQYALYAVACLRGGLRPDLLNDAGWWRSRLWIYATYALVIYTRAAAERRGREQRAHRRAPRAPADGGKHTAPGCGRPGRRLTQSMRTRLPRRPGRADAYGLR
jgi:hypothetical protein